MIENSFDKESYKKISVILMFFTLALWVYMSYITYYSVFSKFYQNNYFNDFIIKIHSTHPNPIINMGLVIVLFTTALFTFSPASPIEENKKRIFGQIGIAGIALFFGLSVYQYYFNLGLLGALFNIIFFLAMFYSLFNWRKSVKKDLMDDRINLVASQFDQSRGKIENDYSVNIPFFYSFKGVRKSSWINVVNPFRASLIGGTPGSGKTYTAIEEMMRQFTRKGFTGVIYDFKFPTLTIKQYNYTTWYQERHTIKPNFYVINFDDPEYSHRCNPINIDSLKSLADADENTKVLMLNINKTWIDKEGDFFTDSANVFTSMLMWYLKLVSEKYDYDICSFPHLVALSTYESIEILFLILKEYSDLKPKMTPFSQALEKGALEQLAGQVSSAGIALAKITSVEINYILTGNDFSFDLNDPLAPKILSVGNNPDRQQTYSAPIGLILTKISKTLNKQKQLPSMYVIDEFPTVYIRGIDNLIATGRSNKIATVLGFQSFAQIVADYGKDISDKILRICGTRIMGQMMDDDAKIVSENLGKIKIETTSYSYSSDVSETNNVTMEDIVPAAQISQFSQGTFCGIIADDFLQKNDNKIFIGELTPPIDLKKKEEDIKLPKIYNFIPEDLETQIEILNIQSEDELIVIKNILLAYQIDQWIIILEDTTTKDEFYEFFIGQHNLNYQIFKPLLVTIDFKDNLNDYFRSILMSGDSLKRLFEDKELEVLLQEMIKKGICKRYKNDFLQSYNNDIYNDIYRIVAMELINLKIVDEIKNTSVKGLKSNSAKFFQKIVNSEKFDDKLIKKKYQEIIEQLSN